MVVQALRYEEWNSLLLTRYFGEERAGQPAYLDVDDDSLDALAGADRPGEGAASLVDAVRPRLRLNDEAQLFDTVFQEAMAWAGGGFRGAPPFLPTLAVMVLAATRMAPEAGVSTANYYLRLWQLLEIRGDPQAACRETIPVMFRMLESWLDQRRQGRRGRSTLPPDPHTNVVGLAVSQALMREADRRRLSQFFARLGLDPADAAHARDLVPALRRWAERSGLTVAGKRFVANRGLEARLVHLITTELRDWDRTERDDEGRRVAAIQILLRVVPNPRWGLLAARRPGFPERAVFYDAHHSLELVSEPGDDTYAPYWLSGPDDSVLADGLRVGLTLHADNVSLRLSSQQVVPLRADPRVGALSSRARVELGEMHWILVAEAVADPVADYLTRVAGGELERLARGVPEGWAVYRNIVIESRGPADVPSGLAPLVPAVDARPELHGGLALRLPEGGRGYLKGGEPDLWVPDWLLASGVSRWRLDGVERALDSEVQRLSGVELAEGTHIVEVSNYRLSLRVVQAVASWPNEEPAFTTIHCDLPVTEGEGSSDVRVCGARIFGERSDPDRRPPVLLPYGGTRYTLLGAIPGEVQSGPPPGVPEWLADVGLLPKDFEVFPSFPAIWAIIDWPHAGREARVLCRLEPRAGIGVESESLWAEELLEPASLQDPASYDLWRSYRQCARPLVATVVGS